MTEQDERTLLAGLRALREAAAEEGASPEVGATVASAFRAMQRRRRVVAWLCVGAAAAAAVVAAIALRPTAAVPAPVVVKAVKPAAPVLERTVENAAPRVVAKRRVARKRQPVRGISAPVESGFIPVMMGPPLQQGDLATVVRVEMPRSSLRAFGIPFTEERRSERINADVVVGQDGLVRAVRFVR